MTNEGSLLRLTLFMSLLAAVAVCLAVFPGQARSAFEADTSFGKGGLVTGQVGPIATSSTLGTRVFARDGRGRAIVGAASGGDWLVWRLRKDGSFDPTFGDGGEVVISDWGHVNRDYGAAVMASAVIRPDGRILLVGYVGSYPSGAIRRDTAWFVMKQLMPDGSPDSAFGSSNGGKSFSNDRGAVRIALRPDGGFFVAAFKQLRQTGRTDDGALYSFSESGRLVRDFGPGNNVDSVNVLGAPGKASYLFDVDLLPGGRILVCGTVKNRLLLMRLNADGSRDRSFGKGGQVSWLLPGDGLAWASARDMEIDRQGRILVTGSTDPIDPSDAAYGLVMRFQKNGRFDRSFGDDGVTRLYATPTRGVGRRTSLYDVTVDSKGGIWVAGSAGLEDRNQRRAIAVRYLTNGRKDPDFFRKGVLRIRLGDGSVGTATLRDGRGIYLSGRYDHGDQERFFLKRLKQG